jgi:hypothetical protein
MQLDLGGGDLTYLSKGVAKTELKRDHKVRLLASIKTGACDPSHGMTKEEAILILSQDIADYDAILARFRDRV